MVVSCKDNTQNVFTAKYVYFFLYSGAFELSYLHFSLSYMLMMVVGKKVWRIKDVSCRDVPHKLKVCFLTSSEALNVSVA